MVLQYHVEVQGIRVWDGIGVGSLGGGTRACTGIGIGDTSLCQELSTKWPSWSTNMQQQFSVVFIDFPNTTRVEVKSVPLHSTAFTTKTRKQTHETKTRNKYAETYLLRLLLRL